MKQFDRANIRTLRSEIEIALSTVARHHNISLDLGTIRFSSLEGNFRVKLTGAVLNHSPQVPWNGLTERKPGPGVNPVLENALSFFGIPTSTRCFRSHGTLYQLQTAKLSRPKYPFIGIGPQGGRYKFSASTVKSGAIS